LPGMFQMSPFHPVRSPNATRNTGAKATEETLKNTVNAPPADEGEEGVGATMTVVVVVVVVVGRTEIEGTTGGEEKGPGTRMMGIVVEVGTVEAQVDTTIGMEEADLIPIMVPVRLATPHTMGGNKHLLHRLMIVWNKLKRFNSSWQR